MELSLNEVIRKFNFGREFDEDLQISGVSIDSRTISCGDIFIAIRGENFDGHSFVNDVLKKGAVCAIVEDNSFSGKNEVFRVENTVEFLQELAKFYVEKFNVKKIGITGSVGKSTIKEMVSSIFETEFNVVKTDGNFNGQIGLPLTCFKINKKTQIVVFEMGISEKGEMEKLCEIVNPDISLINNVGVSHLGNFGNLETTCKEKFKIASNGCKLILNADNSELFNYSQNMENVVYFGISGNFDYGAENVFSSGSETEFTLITKSYRESIKIPCIGIHNVYNALAAISLSIEFGMHIEDIKKGIMNFKPLPMRQKIINFENFTLIDDSYNASPDSVKASLNLLQSIKTPGRNILVIADILELGDYSREIHFELGKYVASCKVDVVISVGDYSKYICESIKMSNNDIETYIFNSNDDAYVKLLQILQNNDKILVKGSRGMRMNEVVDKIKKEFGEVIHNEDFEKG